MSNFLNTFKPYRNREFCFLDVETTGVKPGYHEITEIGLRHAKLGGLCLQVAPRHIERAEHEALKISRYNVVDWVDAKHFEAYEEKLSDFVDGATIVAHNAMFDISMIKGQYDMLGLECGHLFRDVIDTMALARAFLVPLGLNRLSLQACMAFIGESYEGAHNAYEDAIFAEKLYNYIISNLKWHGKINGKRVQEQLF